MDGKGFSGMAADQLIKLIDGLAEIVNDRGIDLLEIGDLKIVRGKQDIAKQQTTGGSGATFSKQTLREMEDQILFGDGN